MRYLLILFLFYSVSSYGKEKKVIYKYRKTQKIDVGSIEIHGDYGIPDDISITPMKGKDFPNKLPYRKNFNREIRLGVERVY